MEGGSKSKIEHVMVVEVMPDVAAQGASQGSVVARSRSREALRLVALSLDLSSRIAPFIPRLLSSTGI